MTLTYFALAAFASILALPLSAQVKLRGNRHPLARAEFDPGPVAPDQPMDRMNLVVKIHPARQAERRDLAPP